MSSAGPRTKPCPSGCWTPSLTSNLIATADGVQAVTGRFKAVDILVNSILPGPTRSEGVGTFIRELAKAQHMTEEDFEEVFFNEMRPTSLIQRFADTREIASLVVYTCSPRASATNGAALRVDGGVVRAIP